MIGDEFLQIGPPKAKHLPSTWPGAQPHRGNPRVPAGSVRLHPINRNTKPLGYFARIEQAFRAAWK